MPEVPADQLGQRDLEQQRLPNVNGLRVGVKQVYRNNVPPMRALDATTPAQRANHLRTRMSEVAGVANLKPLQRAMQETDGNILVSAPHHAGKTFGWIAQVCALVPENNPDDGAPVLVICNTHQAAQDIHQQLKQLLGDDYYIGLVHGTAPSVFADEENARQANSIIGARAVVGTIGRLCKWIEENTLDVSGVKAVVLEETYFVFLNETLHRLLSQLHAKTRGPFRCIGVTAQQVDEAVSRQAHQVLGDHTELCAGMTPLDLIKLKHDWSHVDANLDAIVHKITEIVENAEYINTGIQIFVPRRYQATNLTQALQGLPGSHSCLAGDMQTNDRKTLFMSYHLERRAGRPQPRTLISTPPFSAAGLSTTGIVIIVDPANITEWSSAASRPKHEQ